MARKSKPATGRPIVINNSGTDSGFSVFYSLFGWILG
jgi:hypothetical protein